VVVGSAWRIRKWSKINTKRKASKYTNPHVVAAPHPSAADRVELWKQHSKAALHVAVSDRVSLVLVRSTATRWMSLAADVVYVVWCGGGDDDDDECLGSACVDRRSCNGCFVQEVRRLRCLCLAACGGVS
jgi:hypothetical protein